MEERIPKYNIDFRKADQDHFFLHVQQKTDQPRGATSDPHSHNYYCLSYLYEGATPHFSDMDNNLINAPALLVLNIDQVHIHTDLKDCKIISMAFSSDFIHGQNKKIADHIETVFSSPYLILSPNQLTELDRYIQLIVAEYAKGDVKNFEIIKCLINILLIQSAGFIEQSTGASFHKKDLFSNFKDLLKKQYRSHHKVRFYADSLNISTEVLNQAVKNATSKTPKQLIDERLLMEAKRLLYWSDITVREVAWELGFENDGYFNRFFKKFEGTTPKEFQKIGQQ
jgi:AraC-like DNA-binding protein